MWSYEKRLQFPVRIKTPNAAAAKVIITQYGGPDGELGASMRYLSQRYTMPWRGGPADGYRNRGAGPSGDGERHCIPADKGPFRGRDQAAGLRHLFCGPYGRRVAPGGGRYAVHVHVLCQQGRRHHGSARGHGSRWRDRKRTTMLPLRFCAFFLCTCQSSENIKKQPHIRQGCTAALQKKMSQEIRFTF